MDLFSLQLSRNFDFQILAGKFLELGHCLGFHGADKAQSEIGSLKLKLNACKVRYVLEIFQKKKNEKYPFYLPCRNIVNILHQ